MADTLTFAPIRLLARVENYRTIGARTCLEPLNRF